MHTKFSGAEAGQRAECLNLSLHATARALAKLSAFFANKGTLKGKKLMSEETWNDFHSDEQTKKMLTFLPTTFNKGGLGIWGLDTMEKGMPNHKINDQDRLCHQYRNGMIGWFGIGGSACIYNPERKLSYAYIPSHIAITELFSLKSADIECMVQ
jgi:CubicO group peptidase (beta-lactamase class C family)